MARLGTCRQEALWQQGLVAVAAVRIVSCTARPVGRAPEARLLSLMDLQ